MSVGLKKLSSFIREQFPAFYQEDGDSFIQFTKAYYEWMEEQGPIYDTRRLLEYADIDEVSNEFIDNFLSKFMYGIPRTVLTNKALLEKNILDVYRSKGSVEGLKLLFRILYDLEVKLFVPQVDMLRTSAGNWRTNEYLEVDENIYNSLYNKKTITGSTSGATAFVTTVGQINTGSAFDNNETVTNVMYINDIVPGPSGTRFLIGEYLIIDGLDILKSTKIKGSATGATVFTSSENHEAGHILVSNSYSGEGIKFGVSTLLDSEKSKGYLTFLIRNGGYGYSNSANITISAGQNTSGSGATFKIKELSNTITFTYNTNQLWSETSKLISDASYGANLNSASVDSVIGNALTDANVTIGNIKSLTGVSSGDHHYDGYVAIKVTDHKITGYGITDENGKLWGNNAWITGNPASGNGVMSTVVLVDSGFGYNTNQEFMYVYNPDDPTNYGEVYLQVGAIGKSEGEWLDTSGLLNSDKYIQDSDYYQEYSYEIQLEKSLDKYIGVLKQVYHPVGNRVFGRPIIIDTYKLDQKIVNNAIIITNDDFSKLEK
jgi:hypothetical protein